MTAESYISLFIHSCLPLLVESPPVCVDDRVDDFQYIRRRRDTNANVN